ILCTFFFMKCFAFPMDSVETSDFLVDKLNKGFQNLNLNHKDRISMLPDSILSHILSYLPSKHAVATSILSTRWRYLWTFINVLDFDDSLFLCPYDPNTDKLSQKISFINFVHTVLTLNVSAVEKCSLKCSKSNIDVFQVRAWVSILLLRGVQEIDLCFPSSRNLSVEFVHGFYNLVHLKLGKRFVLNVPKSSVLFPNLKTLYLDSIEFRDNASAENLFGSCLVLEELYVEDCGFRNLKVFKVNNHSLKYMRMKCSFENENDEYNTEFCEYKVVINAPKLEHLEYVDYLAEGYSFKNLHLLQQVYIDVAFGRRTRRNVSKCVDELLKGICNIRVLQITTYTMEVFSYFGGCELPKFCNLTQLAVATNKYCGHLLPNLLDKSPCLESLIIHEGLARFEGSLGDFEWKPPPCVPECILNCLKKIDIWGFNGGDEVMNFIIYIMKRAEFLEEISTSPCMFDSEVISSSHN
ncbi:FBD-associated F-box protein, partial [Quillaja saponaria]